MNPILFSGGTRYPEIWRFKWEQVTIRDDQGRRYHPEQHWRFDAQKIGGKYFMFSVAIPPDARTLSIHVVFVVNDLRFLIDEEFERNQEGSWVKAKHRVPEKGPHNETPTKG